MSRRHPPPSYGEDRAAAPNYVYDDGDEPAYDDPNFETEDPNSRLADDEQQETDEDLARMQQREVDAEVADDAAEHEGDIDADGGGWLEEDRDDDAVRRETAEREPGYEREELDDAYDVDDDDDDDDD